MQASLIPVSLVLRYIYIYVYAFTYIRIFSSIYTCVYMLENKDLILSVFLSGGFGKEERKECILIWI